MVTAPMSSGRFARLGWVAALLAFLAATNKWMSWNAAFHMLLPHDESDYVAIARAAPSLPTSGIQLQHAERFPLHWLLGSLARILHLGAEHAYAIVAPLAVIAVVAALCVLLNRVGVGDRGFVICAGVLILNTYSFRYYLLAPGYVADLLFDLGSLVTLIGLFYRRYPVLLAGVILAALARQSELPTSLALAVVIAFWPAWRTLQRPKRLALAIAPVVITAVIYLVEEHVAKRFSYNPTPGFSHFTVLSELEALPDGAGTLGTHLLRSVNGLLAIAALLLIAVLALRRHTRARLSIEFWGPLLVGAAVAVQPMIFSAQYAAANETRLAVLGLGPLVCALAVALRDLENHGNALPKWAAITITGILLLDSLHHLYTWFGTHDAHQTVALQVICAAALVLVTAKVLLNRSAAAPT